MTRFEPRPSQRRAALYPLPVPISRTAPPSRTARASSILAMTDGIDEELRRSSSSSGRRKSTSSR
jgi:hypothetical protein